MLVRFVRATPATHRAPDGAPGIYCPPCHHPRDRLRGEKRRMGGVGGGRRMEWMGESKAGGRHFVRGDLARGGPLGHEELRFGCG